MNDGTLIALEGLDTSDKQAQFKSLTDHLTKSGYSVEVVEFPRYDEASSYFLKQYAKGKYGSINEVSPYTSSLFFALDRFEASSQIKTALANGKVVITTNYAGSNMAYQGEKFINAEERRGFFIWADNLEFQLLQIPRPHKNYVFRVPGDKNQQRIVEAYDDLCALFPKDFQRIDEYHEGNKLSRKLISDKLWESIQPLLPEKIPSKKTSKEVKMPSAEQATDQNLYIQKVDEDWVISEAGRDYLEHTVTDPDGNVYAFTDEMSPLTVAAAMARLSRRGDDMRVTILDEFAGKADKDASLLERVITAYGDDSVQQLVGQHVVIENASNLLTKQLEWGRLGSYLEQSTRYIYFDKKDAEGKYKYFTPSEFPEDVKTQYEATMDQIFDLYSEMVHELTDYVQQSSTVPESERDIAWKGATRAQACDAIRPVLPTATKSTVGIFDSGQALESLIMHLQASDSLEARETGTQILNEARKVIPTFLQRADNPERGGAMVAYMANTRRAVAKLAGELLTAEHAEPNEPAKLVHFWPANELDLVPYMLYSSTSKSLEAIQDEVDGWSIEQKQRVFDTYMGERLNRRHRPGRALEQAHYTWDIMCDYGIFRDLQRHRMVDDLEWQALTPRYGYEVPELVDEAGLSEKFEECFDLSMQLYSQLQAAGFEYEAQYATLLGHRMRWTVTYNAREAFHLHELRTSPQGHPGYRKLVLQMHEILGEKHPGLADAMQFVNKGEDAELTRLAAERATQYKLNALDKN